VAAGKGGGGREREGETERGGVGGGSRSCSTDDLSQVSHPFDSAVDRLIEACET
jgi:hypothetical protein